MIRDGIKNMPPRHKRAVLIPRDVLRDDAKNAGTGPSRRVLCTFLSPAQRERRGIFPLPQAGEGEGKVLINE